MCAISLVIKMMALYAYKSTVGIVMLALQTSKDGLPSFSPTDAKKAWSAALAKSSG